jgi:radical SAM protein with 4Fe4S-binding SPASM domain
MKEYNVLRELNNSDKSTMHPGEMFQKLWDINAIQDCLHHAKTFNDLPRFHLDKVEIHPAHSCNLRCSFCYGQTVTPPINMRKMLKKEAIISVLNDIRTNMPEEDPLIILAGLYSEPLLHPDLASIVEKLGRLEYRFGIYTNGLLMDNLLMDVFLDSVVEAKRKKPSYITFNVTASLVSHIPIEKLLSAIKTLSQKKSQAHSPLVINASLHAVTEINDFLSIGKKLSDAGVDNIRLSFPWEPQLNDESKRYCGLSKQNYNAIINQFETLRSVLPDKISVRYPPRKLFDHCFVMSMGLSISSEGDVFPCPEASTSLFKDRFSYGSIYEKPLSDIWHSQRHKELFQTLDPEKEQCVCCHTDEELNRLCAMYFR